MTFHTHNPSAQVRANAALRQRVEEQAAEIERLRRVIDDCMRDPQALSPWQK